MSGEHHGELELRRFRVGELTGAKAREVADHVPECETCRQRLAEIDAERERFHQSIGFERFAAGVERASRERGRRRRPRVPRFVVPAMAVAAAAGVALALFVRAPVGPTGLDRLKGGGATADFYVGGLGRTRIAASREPLAPGERVRIAYRAGRYHFLTVVSVDQSGEVSPLYPVSGESMKVPSGRHVTTLLPGSVAFDGHGPERVIVLFTDKPVSVDTVEAKARAAWKAAGGDVDRLPSLGLPGEELGRVFLKP